MPNEKKPKTKCVEYLRHAEYYDMQSTFDELYARSQAGEIFENLMDVILSRENILLAYRNIKSNTGSITPGTDKLEISDIGKLTADEVTARVRKIVKGAKNGYTPRSVRRKDIPKPNGNTRPLGIPCIWDRLVQQCIKQVMEPICEARFSNNSYGFRPNRSVENAIAAIYRLMQKSGLHYVVEFDIKGFFDNVNHEWLMKFLRNDIADPNYLRYIARMLKSGVMIEGKYEDTSVGTPQGGLISPILANVYLHYVLDLWFEKCIKKQLYGEAYLVRFADDFLIMFQYERDAQRVYEAIIKRMELFGLELSKEKTRILPFGRYSGSRETFDFLGFTHFNSKTRKGYYSVGHKISRKKKKQFKSNLKKWVKENRNTQFDEFMKALNKKLTGSFNYYSLSGMIKEVRNLWQHSLYVTFKWLNRRSQRRSFKLERFYEIWNDRIIHPYIHVDIWSSDKVIYNKNV